MGPQEVLLCGCSNKVSVCLSEAFPTHYVTQALEHGLMLIQQPLLQAAAVMEAVVSALPMWL